MTSCINISPLYKYSFTCVLAEQIVGLRWCADVDSTSNDILYVIVREVVDIPERMKNHIEKLAYREGARRVVFEEDFI